MLDIGPCGHFLFETHRVPSLLTNETLLATGSEIAVSAPGWVGGRRQMEGGSEWKQRGTSRVGDGGKGWGPWVGGGVFGGPRKAPGALLCLGGDPCPSVLVLEVTPL